MTKNLKNISTPGNKRDWKKSSWTGKSLFRLKKYYDYDDTEFTEIRDIGNLFDETDEDITNQRKPKVLLMVIT